MTEAGSPKRAEKANSRGKGSKRLIVCLALAISTLALIAAGVTVAGLHRTQVAAAQDSTTIPASVQIELQDLSGSAPTAGSGSPVVAGTTVQPLRVLADNTADVLWLLSWGDNGPSLIKYDTVQGTVKHYELDGLPLTTGYYLGFSQAPDGHIWVGAGTTLVEFDPSTESQTSFQLPAARTIAIVPAGVEDAHKDHIIFSLVADRSNRVWLTRGGVQAVAEFDPSTGAYSEYKAPDGLASAESLQLASDGRLWVSGGESSKQTGGSNADNVAAVFDPSNNDFTTYTFDKAISGVAQSADGSVWFGGSTVTVLNPKTGEIAPTGYRGSVIGADNTGHVWLANDDTEKLTEIDESLSLVKELQFPETLANAITPYGQDGTEVWTGPDLSHLVPTSAVVSSSTIWLTTPGTSGVWRIAAD